MPSPVKYFDIHPYVVAIVGAGSGIGRAATLLLAGQGVTVHCVDRNGKAAHETAGEAERLSAGAAATEADVSLAEDADRVIAEALKAHGTLHGLVNCAGITGRTAIKAHEVDVDDFDAVYRVNLRAAFLLSRAVLPHMVKNGYGRLLHVASIAGKDGNAGMTAYSATKAGLIGMVKSMGKDYAETGVTINALAPAVIRTPMVDALPEAQIKYMTDKIPMRRCGELDEAAKLIAWVVSPACSFTTGFTFDLTGGRATY